MSLQGVIGSIFEIRRSETELLFEWKISNFFSLTIDCGDRYVSDDFFFDKTRWCFLFHPNGTLKNSSVGLVSLFLMRDDRGPPVTVKVRIGIKGVNGVEEEREKGQEFSEKDYVCVWFGFSSVSYLELRQSTLVPNNTLTIVCNMKSVVLPISRDVSIQTDMVFQEAKAPLKENQSLGKKGVEEWQKSLLKWLESGKESDVIIKVKGKKFPAHRQFLQARSLVFEAMLSHDTLERQSGVVAIDDCDPEIFPDFLKHVYTGSTEVITAENVFGLHAASDKYDLPALREGCVEFLKGNLTVANFCDTICLAVKHDEKELIKAATGFFSADPIAIVKTAEWQTFLAENPTVGNELFILSYSQRA